MLIIRLKLNISHTLLNKVRTHYLDDCFPTYLLTFLFNHIKNSQSGINHFKRMFYKKPQILHSKLRIWISVY